MEPTAIAMTEDTDSDNLETGEFVKYKGVWYTAHESGRGLREATEAEITELDLD